MYRITVNTRCCVKVIRSGWDFSHHTCSVLPGAEFCRLSSVSFFMACLFWNALFIAYVIRSVKTEAIHVVTGLCYCWILSNSLYLFSSPANWGVSCAPHKSSKPTNHFKCCWFRLQPLHYWSSCQNLVESLFALQLVWTAYVRVLTRCVMSRFWTLA